MRDHSLCGLCCHCSIHYLFHVAASFITFGLLVLTIRHTVHPKGVNIYITKASLTEFDYTNSTLHYNLALDITFDNHRNKKMTIHYEYIEVWTLFQDARFGLETLAPFYQYEKDTTVLSHVFKGQQPVALSADQLDKEKRKGVYDIQVFILSKIRFFFEGKERDEQTEEVACHLQVPLTSSNKGTFSFNATKCEGDLSYDYFNLMS